MKVLSLFKFSILFLLSLSSVSVFSQNTNTSTSGTWSTAGNWTNGAPSLSSGNDTIKHVMTLNTTLTITGGNYIFNAKVSDPVDASDFNIVMSGTSKVDVNANVTIGGILQLNGAGAKVYVRNGDTLTVGDPLNTGTSSFNNGSLLTVDSGGVVIFNGNVQFNSNSLATINGAVIINGTYTGNHSAAISGTGTMNSTGTMTNNSGGTIFGSGNDCASGPCSGNNLCATNTIAAAQTICSGVAPAGLTGNNPGGSFTYQWQKSTTSSTTGFTNVAGATGQNYSPGTLTSNTWYRRVTTDGSCTATAVGIKMTVNPSLTPDVSISGTASTVCAATSVTFTATPTNGGAGPAYQWKKNNVNVGTGSTYTNAAWTNSDAITCVLTSNYSCLTATTATSNTITMTVLSGGGSWSGANNTNWNTSNNWCSGATPVAGTDVVLNSGVLNQPSVTSNAAVCNNLTINSGATLTVTGNTLAVGGNLVINSGGTLVITGSILTVSGSITINAGATLIVTSPGALSAKTSIVNNGTLSGTGTTTLNGTLSQSISAGSYSNLTLNNSAGCTVSGAATVTGVLTLTSGALASGGNLTIDLSTGAIAGTGSGTITGNINVTRSISSSRYHYISSPLVNSMTFAQWNDDVTLVSGQYNSLYYYDETIASPSDVVGWTAVGSNLASPIATLKGYALFFSGAATLDQTGTYTHLAPITNVTLTNTISTDLNVDGWNLVGNPYPSTIDWDAAGGWTKSGLINSIYFWDPVNNRYASYVNSIGTNGGTHYIPAGQAFWVRVSASGGTGTFGMNDLVRTTTTSTPSFWRLASAPEKVLKLTASTGSYSDETILRFREDALNLFDDHLDAYKLKNDENTPSLYTMLSKDEYSVNSLSDTTTEISIPLHLKAGLTGQYMINAEEIGAFDDDYEIILEDNLIGLTQDLRAIPSYEFQVNPGDTTGRFFINFKKANLTTSTYNPQAASNVSIRSSESTVYLNFSNVTSQNGDIAVFNTMGSQVARIKNADISSNQYSLDLPGETGIYLVRVIINNEAFTKKVYLK